MTTEIAEDSSAGLDDWLNDEGARSPASDDDAVPPSAVLTRFEHLGPLGRGGMGYVRLVRDRALRREAAMKILAPELADHPNAREDFIEEARIASRLEHPNMVPVHELGVDAAGTVYFTMKVVRGTDLETWSRPLPPGSMERLSEGLEVFLKVCDAVAYAHSRGVIHRDIKPSNVMVGEFGEVYLVDWGLARAKSDTARDEPRGDETPMVIGTKSYMPPEQAAGRSNYADERSDVFGLGALLYHIVTGRPPYPGDDPAAVEAAAEACAYVPVAEALGETRISARLSRIIDRSMRKDPSARFPSALHLKRAVQRFVRGGLHLPRRAFPAGTTILREGEPGDEAFIVVSGTCEAYRMIDGERHVLCQMVPGDVFGEMAILAQTTRTASVDALDAVTVLVISRDTMALEFGEGSWIGKLLVSLAGRFRDLDERLAVATGIER